jgi:hypothetical protein
MLRENSSLSPEMRERVMKIEGAAERIRTIVVDMNPSTRSGPSSMRAAACPR